MRYVRGRATWALRKTARIHNRKKYKITGESKLADGVTVHRIRALRKFTVADGSVVEAGAPGGWIEREDNLSQDVSIWDSKAAAAWAADNATVRDVRLRDLPAEEQAARRAKTRAEKRAANQAAAEKAEADGTTLG